VGLKRSRAQWELELEAGRFPVLSGCGREAAGVETLASAMGKRAKKAGVDLALHLPSQLPSCSGAIKQPEYRIRAIGVRLKWAVPPAVLVWTPVSRQKRG
jgi:hypothetical protein